MVGGRGQQMVGDAGQMVRVAANGWGRGAEAPELATTENDVGSVSVVSNTKETVLSPVMFDMASVVSCPLVSRVAQILLAVSSSDSTRELHRLASRAGGGGEGPGDDLLWNFQKIFVNSAGWPEVRMFQDYNVESVEQQEAQAPALDPVQASIPTRTTTTKEAQAPALDPVQAVHEPELELLKEGTTTDVADVTTPETTGLWALDVHEPELELLKEGTTTDVADVTTPETTGLWALSAVDIDGNTVPLSKFQGAKATITHHHIPSHTITYLTNVPAPAPPLQSAVDIDGNTGLVALYSKYHSQGLEILGFPCNQFGKQESKGEADIKSFCTDNYGVNFPMFSKLEVNGPNTHPVYQFLKKNLPSQQGGGGGEGPGEELVWNFQKIFVNSAGWPEVRMYQDYTVGNVERQVMLMLGITPTTATPTTTTTTTQEAQAPVLDPVQESIPTTTTTTQEAQAPVLEPVQAQAQTSLPQAQAQTVFSTATSLYELTAVGIDGTVQDLSQFKGKVTLVVNVASECGYTDSNYKGLVETYRKYKKHGLEILAFPCNQFGQQEPKSEAEIKSFCADTFGVDFPMFSKVEVNGPNTSPVYQFLKKNLPFNLGGGGGSGTGQKPEIKWNFEKFVVDQRGMPVLLLPSDFVAADLELEIYRLLHIASV
eukprot:gene5651-8981_t